MTPTFALMANGRPELDPAVVLDAFRTHRARVLANLGALDEAPWLGPTRCPEWTVQDVVRHLADASLEASELVPGGPSPLDGFDARSTPNEWLARSQGETPAQSLDRLATTSAELEARARGWIDEGLSFGMTAHYGVPDWSTLFTHALWDSWVHERDIFLPLGATPSPGEDETRLSVAYGLFLAAATATLAGPPVEAELHMSGLGGGTFRLSGPDGARLDVSADGATGPDAVEMADALAGRVDDAPAVLVEAFGEAGASLAFLGQFFNTPVG